MPSLVRRAARRKPPKRSKTNSSAELENELEVAVGGGKSRDGVYESRARQSRCETAGAGEDDLGAEPCRAAERTNLERCEPPSAASEDMTTSTATSTA